MSTSIQIARGDACNFEPGHVVRFERRPVWWQPWTWPRLRRLLGFGPRWHYAEITTIDRLNGVITVEPASGWNPLNRRG